ncbi:MAG: preprotein translocase subunit SecE [Oscillospiraceae bacterium]|jgi:preprotein translocase subunit SecE
MADKASDKKQASGSKQQKKKKPGLFKRIGKFLRDTRGEYRKIVWPTWKQVWKNAVVVLACVLIVAVVVWGIDALFSWIRAIIFTS